MKKISLLVAGLFAAGVANADPVVLQGSSTINQSGPPYECQNHLASDVRINLSSGVIAAVNCVAGSTNMIFGTCHTAGLQTERTAHIVCEENPEDDSTTAACDGQDAIERGYNISAPERGSSFYTASTRGGPLGITGFDGTFCGTDTIATKVTP